MGRQPTIDRDRVLDSAEAIVSTHGASSLTFDMLAKVVGITKGGVQSCFRNKEALIHEMLQRTIKRYEDAIEQRIGRSASIKEKIQAHVALTFDDIDENQRAASLMAALFQYPDSLAVVRAWYQKTLADIIIDTVSQKNLRLALLAVEGAFFLRFFNLVDIKSEQWLLIKEDIDSLLAPVE